MRHREREIICVCVKERGREREREGGRERVCVCERKRSRERDYFFSLVHSSNICNSRDWARQKPGTRNSICVFHVGVRDPHI